MKFIFSERRNLLVSRMLGCIIGVILILTGTNVLAEDLDNTLWIMNISDSIGQSGDPTLHSTPIQIGTCATQVAAGYSHSLYILHKKTKTLAPIIQLLLEE